MAIKFELDQPLTLRFPYGDFKPIEAASGPLFLYTVETEGGRDRLCADGALHAKLQQAQVGPGALLTVTQSAEEGQRRWLVQQAESSSRPKPDYDQVEQLMQHCLRRSWESWYNLADESHFTSEDVRAVGITLFLECTRKGIYPQALPAEPLTA